MSNPYEGIPKFETLSRVEIEPEFADYAPGGFRDDPFGYFEARGVDVKESPRTHDKVKDFPKWEDTQGNSIAVLGKRVDVDKAEAGKSGDPFYEFEIMKKIQAVDLPCPKPIAKASKGDSHLIVMERVPGFRTTTIDKKRLSEQGITDDDIPGLMEQVTEHMRVLQARFEAAGFTRKWQPKDMIFDIDVAAKKIRNVIPTDWERTTVDTEKYEAYKKALLERKAEKA